MPCLKIVPNSYSNPGSLENVINYVYRKACYIGGMSVDPLNAAAHMKLIKDVWFKNGGNQLMHFVLCFSEQESNIIPSAISLRDTAYYICEHYRREYQIVFGIHKSNRWHIHFVVNSVNFLTGEKLPTSEKHDIALAKYIGIILHCRNVPIFYS